MSLSDEERKALVLYRLEKAHNTYEQILNIVPLAYWNMIANRLYYAAYYAVSALLLNEGHTVQTHHGIIQMLGLFFIKTERISKEYGNLYSRLFSIRQTGDYGDTFDLTEDDVLPLIEPTGKLIETINTLIENN